MRKNIIPSAKLTTHLPEDLLTRLNLHLLSAVEGKVPFGAIAGWISDRIRELDHEVLDLGELSGAVPKGRFWVRGTKESIAQLKALFEK